MVHLPPLIADLAMILAVAGLVTLVFQKIRQPVVLGYIVAGVIVGPYTPIPLSVMDVPNVKVLAELGVIFLIFSLGLEFTFHKLVSVGAAATGTAVVEVILMVAAGYGTGLFLGWSELDSVFLGGILSISSTTIIIKAFDALGLKKRRFAEIVFGVLIVEDLVAILLLVALSAVAKTNSLLSIELAFSAIQLVVVVGTWFLVGYLLIPTFLRKAANYLASETLTVLACGLCLFLAVLATRFGYSSALGAFIMGSILAETDQSHRIEALILPIRDLFAGVFFVSVGMLVDPKLLQEHLFSIVVITIVTIGAKILSSSLGALMTGQPLKRSIQIGFSLAQIGEFSFIIATLGSTLNVTSDFLYPIAVAVSVLTTFATPFLIGISEKCAELFEKMLPAGMSRRLAGYSMWAQNPRQTSEFRGSMLRRVSRLIGNGLLITAIFVGIARYGLNYLERFGEQSVLVGWFMAIGISAPFVWGMYFAFRPPKKSKTRGGSLNFFLGRLGTVVWLSLLSIAFFPTFGSLLVMLLVSAVVFFTSYQRLEKSYQWFERLLVRNLRSNGDSRDAVLGQLAPWDLHLTRLVVNPNSTLAGETLQGANVRTQFGLNVAAIQRGAELIGAPTANAKLFPGDELLVLGADSEIEKFRSVIETPKSGLEGSSMSLHELERVMIESGSPFQGQTIRESGIREKLKGLVVGLERGTFRTMNPDPATVLSTGDVLWLVSLR